MRSLIGLTILSFAIGTGAALAQTPAPTAQPSPPSEMSQDQKKAISKSCTDQANAKGLHGKARKKFKKHCKNAGGTPRQ